MEYRVTNFSDESVDLGPDQDPLAPGASAVIPRSLRNYRRLREAEQAKRVVVEPIPKVGLDVLPPAQEPEPEPEAEVEAEAEEPEVEATTTWTLDDFSALSAPDQKEALKSVGIIGSDRNKAVRQAAYKTYLESI